MKVKDIKLNVKYSYKDYIVKVVRRNKNSYTNRWETGFGKQITNSVTKLFIYLFLILISWGTAVLAFKILA